MEDFISWAIFGAGCSGIALVLVGADFASTSLGNRSILGVDYKTKKSEVLIKWVLGSMCVGFLSQFTEIIRSDRWGMAIVAISWPAILGKVADTLRGQDPNPQLEEEEVEDLHDEDD